MAPQCILTGGLKAAFFSSHSSRNHQSSSCWSPSTPESLIFLLALALLLADPSLDDVSSLPGIFGPGFFGSESAHRVCSDRPHSPTWWEFSHLRTDYRAISPSLYLWVSDIISRTCSVVHYLLLQWCVLQKQDTVRLISHWAFWTEKSGTHLVPDKCLLNEPMNRRVPESSNLGGRDFSWINPIQYVLLSSVTLASYSTFVRALFHVSKLEIIF